MQRSVLKEVQISAVSEEDESEENDAMSFATSGNATERNLQSSDDENELPSISVEEENFVASTSGSTSNACQMTDLSAVEIAQLIKNNQYLTAKVSQLQEQLNIYYLNERFFSKDRNTRYYTGLPNKRILDVTFNQIRDNVRHGPQNILSQFQEFILFLMKLRLNLDFQDLGNRFAVSQSSASRIFSKWLDAAYYEFEDVIVWPEREALMMTMPSSFRRTFGTQVAVIVDCFELFISRPSALIIRAATWSNYKQHNTVKYLIGITPQGTISFASEGYGGRVPDKQITEGCGILNNLLPGDVVLADRGFNNTTESIGFYCGKLVTPASARGKIQLSPEEVQKTRNMASVRVHVERVIGQVKKKYKILQSSHIPIDYMIIKSGDDTVPFDKIVRVSCALTNLTPSVVPD